jgi:hypothetical protein
LKYSEIYENIRTSKSIDDNTIQLIKKAVEEFIQKFKKS